MTPSLKVNPYYREDFDQLIQCFHSKNILHEIITDVAEKDRVSRKMELMFPFSDAASIEPNMNKLAAHQCFQWRSWEEEVEVFFKAISWMLRHSKFETKTVSIVFNEYSLPILEIPLRDIISCYAQIANVEKGWVFSSSERLIVERRYEGRTICGMV